MSYANIDPVLDQWSGTRNIVVLRESHEPQRRLFYISNQTETLSVVLAPEVNAEVRIDLFLIESRDDNVDLHQTWRVPVEDLVEALDVAVGEIAKWFDKMA